MSARWRSCVRNLIAQCAKLPLVHLASESACKTYDSPTIDCSLPALVEAISYHKPGHPPPGVQNLHRETSTLLTSRMGVGPLAAFAFDCASISCSAFSAGCYLVVLACLLFFKAASKLLSLLRSLLPICGTSVDNLYFDGSSSY